MTITFLDTPKKDCSFTKSPQRPTKVLWSVDITQNTADHSHSSILPDEVSFLLNTRHPAPPVREAIVGSSIIIRRLRLRSVGGCSEAAAVRADGGAIPFTVGAKSSLLNCVASCAMRRCVFHAIC